MFDVLPGYIMVEFDAPAETAGSGLIVAPEQARRWPELARVLRVGGPVISYDAKGNKMVTEPPPIKAGDMVPLREGRLRDTRIYLGDKQRVPDFSNEFVWFASFRDLHAVKR
jgi:hypothetical protein